jgi:hypothetical protein
LVFVGDSLESTQIFMYQNSLPNYVKITKPQVLQLIKKFIDILFLKKAPSSISNLVFYKKIYDLLVLDRIYSEEAFEAKFIKDGLPFNDCFASLEKGKKDIIPLPYDRNIMSGPNLIKSNYQQAIIQKVGQTILQGFVKLEKRTENFLNVLCEGCDLKLNTLRGFLRCLITARIEGDNWQSAVWVCGPSATAKSTWAELAKLFVFDPKYICQFSREQNQFSNEELKHCRLLIISDVEYLTKEQKDILKRLLGRDWLTAEQKNVQGVVSFRPKCLVLFVSNKTPEEFPVLNQDPAFLEKINVLKYSTNSILDPEDPIADLRKHLHTYIPELFVWASYAPSQLLQLQTRSKIYREINKSRSKGTQKGFSEFLAVTY